VRWNDYAATLKTNWNHMQNHKDNIDHITRGLDAAVDELDKLTLVRLRSARKQALADASKPKSVWGQRRWLTPAAGLATACLLVVLIGLQWWSPETTQGTLLAAQDMDIMMAQDDLELYSDLEFYRWLDRTHAS
jgi:hypothetical protein